MMIGDLSTELWAMLSFLLRGQKGLLPVSNASRVAATKALREKALMFSRAQVIHCIGDSHTRIFESVQYHFWHTLFRFCVVDGATAMGVENPNSATKAGAIFETYLRSIPIQHHVLVCLGEVDCGFVIWYRSAKYESSVDAQLRQSLYHYFSFISGIKKRTAGRVIVCSAPLPTIKDGQDWGEVANLRRDVKTSQLDRTRLTIEFNSGVRAFCIEHALHYLDLESRTLNRQSGLVGTEFLSQDPLDHHLNGSKLRTWIRRELNRLGLW